MNSELERVIAEVEKVITGKRDVIDRVLMAILARGNILLDDVPGVGKTTLAMAIGKVLGLNYRRIQFTPDVLPSDIVGFSIYDKESGALNFVPGIIHDANILLGDEINRTSSKTQSALLEAMEEGQVTVDGNTYPLKNPFVVIATQNHVGTAGTQLLPNAQLDRFLICIRIGYPDRESQMAIIRGEHGLNRMGEMEQIVNLEELLRMQDEVEGLFMKDSVVSYIAELAEASRENKYMELGLGPRGALAVSRMAKACAYLKGRDYVIPEDVICIFQDVCGHRILLNQKARLGKKTKAEVLREILDAVEVPDMRDSDRKR